VEPTTLGLGHQSLPPARMLLAQPGLGPGSVLALDVQDPPVEAGERVTVPCDDRQTVGQPPRPPLDLFGRRQAVLVRFPPDQWSSLADGDGRQAERLVLRGQSL
jgi:hypothetical protein